MGRLSGLRRFGHMLGQHFSNLTPNMLPKAEEREHIVLVGGVGSGTTEWFLGL